MDKCFRAIRWSGALVMLLILVSGCRFLDTTDVGETRTESQTVELGSASDVDVQIEMSAGRLTLASGADALAETSFRYNVADWQPIVDYVVNGTRGTLRVSQPNNDIPIGGKLINDWDLRLSDAVPINLEVNTGAGEAELDLRGLDLRGLEVEIGAGKTNVDLSSTLNHDLSVTITGGVGELSVTLPTGMGVQVSADTGIGGLTSGGLMRDGDKYVNDAFGEAAHTLYLDISAGVGAIELLEQ